MTSPFCLGPLLVCVALLMVACDRSPPASSNNEVIVAPESLRPEARTALAPADTPPDEASAVPGAAEVPYPVYPNGSKYRAGRENGLRIVVYQTDDEFADVDAFYRDATGPSGMPRLEGMQDFVRYSRADTDHDPWATFRPGIVIHEFDDDEERLAVGARASARTNIILSF